MSKERFERLRQSIIEAGQVMRGEIEPSREFTYEVEAPHLRINAATDWAICVTDEDDALPNALHFGAALNKAFNFYSRDQPYDCGNDIIFALCSFVRKGELFTAPSREALRICPCADTSTPRR